MKSKYVSPSSVTIEMVEEKMIATSIGKSNEHADGDFVELSNKKNRENTIWGEDESIWH